jgi:DNA-binding CsgD family transcriptional regulator
MHDSIPSVLSVLPWIAPSSRSRRAEHVAPEMALPPGHAAASLVPADPVVPTASVVPTAEAPDLDEHRPVRLVRRLRIRPHRESPGPPGPASLVGRDAELAELARLIQMTADGGGGCVVIDGEAGIGKTALLRAAGNLAREAGYRVLTATGVEAEASLPFAGLHQLLRPLFDELRVIPHRQRQAVEAAFGLTEETAPDPFLVALAVLELLSTTAATSPTLLLVDDVQWMDRPTTDALAFVARRIESDRILLLVAARPDAEFTLGGTGVAAEMRLAGIDDLAARSLLDTLAPELTDAVRQRLVGEAAGNPLALVELPAALRSEQLHGQADLPSLLPLTVRLERAFEARLGDLPSATTTLLVIAAIDEGSDVSEVLAAYAATTGRTATVDAFDPAVAAGLLDVEDLHIVFRHPLVRSAIHQAATGIERQVAHAALAKVLDIDSDRRAWHLAASAAGPDDAIAADLERAAQRAQRRGAMGVAIAAQERAARLTVDPAIALSRRLRAAEIAIEGGRMDLATRLMDAPSTTQLLGIDRARYVLVEAAIDPGHPSDRGRLGLLIEAAAGTSDTDRTLGRQLLWTAAERMSWAEPGVELRARVLQVAEVLRADGPDPWFLAVCAGAAPIDRGAAIIAQLESLPADRSRDPMDLWMLGFAAGNAGDFVRASEYLRAAASSLRLQGRLRTLGHIQVLLAWSELMLARWDRAASDADEALRLASDTDQPLLTIGARMAVGFLAGLRDREAEADATLQTVEPLVAASGCDSLRSALALTRGVGALGDGRVDEAYAHLHRIFDPDDAAWQVFERMWAISYLAEAAVLGGRSDDVRGIVAELEAIAARTPSPVLHVGLAFARAVLAEPADDPETKFEDAIRRCGTDWPFDRARIQLAYGAWLRRQRRIADSRAPLRAARDAFDTMGISGWADRARRELRASGERSRRREITAWDQLSPQEWQIARMAAEGLSNREIALQLFLSHRTVGAHLYRIFPKLGITSRGQLHLALDQRSDEVGG